MVGLNGRERVARVEVRLCGVYRAVFMCCTVAKSGCVTRVGGVHRLRVYPIGV